MNVHDAALAWHDAGACVLPAADDGSKRPAVAWDRYKRNRPARAQLDRMLDGVHGIGIVCGQVSDNIEMFEAEGAAVEAGLVQQLTQMLPEALVAKLNTYVERSPKGGVHWIFRVDGMPVKGNTKLARRPIAKTAEAPNGVEVLFETRGEGGWTVTAPSNGTTHPTGKSWQVVYGKPGVIPLLTAEEYRLLHACAATFDAMPDRLTAPAQPAMQPTGGDSPGQDFTAKATWEEILTPAGWTKVRQRGDVIEWVRPGKSARDGISATTGHMGDWLYVFTTSTELEAERTYTKFGAYAAIYHGGDHSTAARTLLQAGYGTRREPRPNPLRVVHGGGDVTDGTGQPQGAQQQSLPGPTPTPMPGAKKPRKIVLTDAPTKIKPVQWWWENRMPLGCLSLLAGREGIGKSVIAYDFAAKLTMGTLRGRWYGIPRTVIICATEDSWAHTITPRLMAAGADMTRVKLAAVQVDETENYFLVLPEDIEGLEAAIKDQGDVALLLLDPLISRLESGLDTHKDADVRIALEPLTALADRTGVGILGLIHVNKSSGNDPLNALMASRAFSAVARAVAFAIVDRDDPTVRLLGCPKNNLGRDDLPSLRYSIEGIKVGETEEGEVFAPKLLWGEEDARSVADVLADNNDHQGREPEALEDAADWLTYYLTENGGLRPSKEVKEAAKKAGHAERTLKRAAKKLEVDMRRIGRPPSTFWALPGSVPPEQPEGGPTSQATGPGERRGQKGGPTTDASWASRARGVIVNGPTTTGPTNNTSSEGGFVVGPSNQDQGAQLAGPGLVGPAGQPPTRAWPDYLPDPEEDPDA